jgi:NAD+ dependent glucose-6-phosphate dehydrogenase
VSELTVITGAAGRVGRLAVAALSGLRPLRLVDVAWPDPPEGDFQLVEADLREPADCERIVSGVHTVVHLAGDPNPEQDPGRALRDVAWLSAALIEACEAAGVRRFIFASSVHTMGLYVRAQQYPIRQEWPARPCCPYGAGKVFDENLLALLAERSDVSAICLRLGLTGSEGKVSSASATKWLGDEDFVGLLRAAMTAPVRFGTYFGVSDADGRYWDPSAAAGDLGFRFAESAPDPTEEEPMKSDPRCLMEPPAAV